MAATVFPRSAIRSMLDALHSACADGLMSKALAMTAQPAAHKAFWDISLSSMNGPVSGDSGIPRCSASDVLFGGTASRKLT